jgi:hypothetical protein
MPRTLAVAKGASHELSRISSGEQARRSDLAMAACVSRTSCLAVGDTNTSGDHGPVFGKLFAEKWNGSTWRMVPVADPGRAILAKVSCASARSCFAVGYRTTVTGADRAISEHWNGTKWSYVRPRRPQPLSQLLGVSCPGPRNCYAAGWTGTRYSVSQRALIEHWDGARWSTRPLPGTPPEESEAVRNLAARPVAPRLPAAPDRSWPAWALAAVAVLTGSLAVLGLAETVLAWLWQRAGDRRSGHNRDLRP